MDLRLGPRSVTVSRCQWGLSGSALTRSQEPLWDELVQNVPQLLVASLWPGRCAAELHHECDRDVTVICRLINRGVLSTYRWASGSLLYAYADREAERIDSDGVPPPRHVSVVLVFLRCLPHSSLVPMWGMC